MSIRWRRFISRAVSAVLAVVLCAPVVAWADTWPDSSTKLQIPAERIGGADRFHTATAMAARSYPGWAGVTDVVVAAGDDASLVDPLSAASLCWAYDAPLLFVSRSSMPASTRSALQAIASANPAVTVHIVGGTKVVPGARVREIMAAIGTDNVEQPWPSGDRYTTAAGIATRVRAVAAEKSLTIPDAAFVANGADSGRFMDALVAAAVSRATGVPLLLTSTSAPPAATRAALAAAGDPEVIVIGGTVAVSDSAYSKLGADARWAGADRYQTGITVAKNAVTRGWSSGGVVGLASALPDALAGATHVGRAGGVVLPTESARLPKELFGFLANPPAPVERCVVFGGPKAIDDAQLKEIQGHPGRPRITSPSSRAVGQTMTVAGTVGGNTTSVSLYVSGVLVGAQNVSSYGSFSFTGVATPTKSGTLEVRATNPDSLTASASMQIERLVYPYATCIIIDKSDFKLYWIKDNRLVKAYPIAVGRTNAETPLGTWKILAKYHTDPKGVYGPRKMRMYRKVGSTYKFTAYNIHGTNQPWVIGTKASAGCIRMYNADVLELFPQVPLGTMVITRN